MNVCTCEILWWINKTLPFERLLVALFNDYLEIKVIF